MNPRVLSVSPGDDFTLNLVFTDGKELVFDMKPYLEHGIFSELKDSSYFRSVGVVLGTAHWPHGQDVCPDTLYEGGLPPRGGKPEKRVSRERKRVHDGQGLKRLKTP